ncbi:MAG: 3-deoxy-manno-octulosonate cytidylyltransferase [Gammaproteobacteria bacterium]|nr:3-deoxy-manno-octulosonate cytidylyltransferase [Gammaproteobacteria bacterium]MDH5593028.1 3-deoxy-manno-octulosonate cytidylyltransferase [Gammaproteobacteria bacterium]MDH5614079.1 3-deoxy-manno-octulosonate cytidylyltransferase [Gammaproteobacteria bacterium]
MSFRVVIPARHASTRLPGKPLLEIAGLPMIQHVYERALDCGADSVVIATDDERIQRVAESFGADVCMTSPDHPSGTDRLAEVVGKLSYDKDDIVVNVQGDEPLMPASLVEQVAELLSQSKSADVATLCTPILDGNDIFNPNVVKVVTDKEGNALYFSRAPVPWHRDAFAQEKDIVLDDSVYFRHIGLYAYRVSFLKQYSSLTPSPLETIESLEQLRVLWHGHKIAVANALDVPGPGVDTIDDLKKVEKILSGN